MKGLAKKLVAVAMVLAMVFTMCACGGGETGGAEDVKVIKMGHPDAQSDNGRFTYTIAKMNEVLNDIAGGKIQFEEIPNGQLGTETDMLNGMGDGSVESCMITVDTYSSQIPEMQIFSLPYLAAYPAQTMVLLDNEEYMADIYKTLEEDWGVVILGGAMYNGSRNLVGKREVNSLADLKDYTIRITTNTMAQETWEALGANPTVIAFSEAYTAFSQGVVDAINCPTETNYIMGFLEVGESLTEMNMFEVISYPMMSKEVWDSLTEEEQGWIQEAAAQAVAYERDRIFESEDEIKKIAEEQGLTVTAPDTKEMKEATLCIHEKYWDFFGDELMQKTYDLLDEDNKAKGYELWSDVWAGR